MKTITIVPYNRPHYLRKVLESIRSNDTSGWHLHIGVEPENDEVIAVCQNVNFMPVSVTINDRILGVHCNNFNAYNHVFDNGSDFNVALEDDTVLAPDALDLANWFYTGYAASDYALMKLCPISKTLDRPLDVTECTDFAPWGWCVTRDKYTRHIKPNWTCDTRGWDFSVWSTMCKYRLKALTPLVARSTTIGRLGGANYTPELFDEHFSGVVASPGGYGKDFNLVLNPDMTWNPC